MNTHQSVWRAIDLIAQRRGLSTSALAKAAGLDGTAFNPSKREYQGRPRWPSTESVAKVLQATGTSWTQFARIVEAGDGKWIPRTALS
jgi:phage repressor protein C with HTH and peptisase S24 domain